MGTRLPHQTPAIWRRRRSQDGRVVEIPCKVIRDDGASCLVVVRNHTGIGGKWLHLSAPRFELEPEVVQTTMDFDRSSIEVRRRMGH